MSTSRWGYRGFVAGSQEFVRVASSVCEGAALFPSGTVGVGDIVRNVKTGEVMQVRSVSQVFEIHPDLWSDWLWEL